MTSLINEERLWGSLRRFFDGSVAEILAELLQNSQRATIDAPPGRRVVEIAIPPPGAGPHTVVYRDRGHGIAGVKGLRVLLTVADSGFADPAVALDQHPLGLGFYSLVARAGVTAVELRSGTLAFALDTARWWGDATYRGSWRERVATLLAAEAIDGFALRIACDEPTRAAFAAALPVGNFSSGHDPRQYASLRSWPALGYAGVLTVRVNGAPVDVETPPALALPGAEIVAEYRGCAARVAFAADRGYLTVNWFGQSIVERSGGPWSAYLVVRAGRPLNPAAPTRAGLIDDDARRAFVAWVAERLFAHVAAAPPASVTPAQLFALHAIDRERFDRECRYAVVECVRPLGDDWPNSWEEIDVADRLVVERAALRDPAMPHLLLDGEVRLAHRAGDGAEAARGRAGARGWWCEGGEHGLASFAGALGQALLIPVLGATTDRHLWWRPDLDPAAPDRWLVAGPGGWGLGTRDEPPTRWRPFPPGISPLFVFGEPTGYDIDDVDRTVATPDPVRFLETRGRAFWCADDDDADASERAYDAGVTALIRRLLGDAVPHLPLADLAARFATGEGRIALLELRYGDGRRGPTGVVAVSETGVRQEFTFYGEAA